MTATQVLPWVSAVGSMVVVPLVAALWLTVQKRLDRTDDRVDKLFTRTDKHAERLSGLSAKIDACPNCPG